MKTLYMETTQISPEKSASEMQKFLKDYDLSKFILDYYKGEIQGVIFAIAINNQDIPYRLPINHLPLWEMSQNGETKYIRNEDQARRVAWRQVLRWIQAQIALVGTGMVKMEEVFLPYMIIDTKKQLTVYDKFLSNQLALGTGGENETEASDE